MKIREDVATGQQLQFAMRAQLFSVYGDSNGGYW
jgi:hypothetical protein